MGGGGLYEPLHEDQEWLLNSEFSLIYNWKSRFWALVRNPSLPSPPEKSWQGARFFKLLLLFVIGTLPITYSFSVELNKKYMYT